MSLPEILQIGTLLSVFAGLYVSWNNNKKITEVHLSINSRMSQLLDATGAAAKAAGVEEGRVAGDVKAATLAQGVLSEAKKE